MAENEESPNEIGDVPPKKGAKLPLILGLVLAILGGGGGYKAVQMGFVGQTSGDSSAESMPQMAEEMPALAFVPLDTLVINLPAHARAQHLLFTAQLEVVPEHSQEVSDFAPRIIDVLNGYLRAVDLSDLEDPTALIRLRAQMLRRVQVVVGEGRVKDLLIMEFVLN